MVHTHVYDYPLFKSGMRTGLGTIALCIKIYYYYVHTKNDNKIDLPYDDKWCTAELIINVYIILIVCREMMNDAV